MRGKNRYITKYLGLVEVHAEDLVNYDTSDQDEEADPEPAAEKQQNNGKCCPDPILLRVSTEQNLLDATMDVDQPEENKAANSENGEKDDEDVEIFIEDPVPQGPKAIKGGEDKVPREHLNKVERKARKKALKAARRAGEQPERLCDICAGAHWSQDCPEKSEKGSNKRKSADEDDEANVAKSRPAKKSKDKSTKAPKVMATKTEKTKNIQNSENGQLAKNKPKEKNAEISAQHLTKRAKRGEAPSPYADGLHAVVKVPRELDGATLTEEEFAACVSMCGLAQMPRAFGVMSKGLWFLAFHGMDAVDAACSRQIVFSKGFYGLKEATTAPIQPYLTGGPQAYVTENGGPYDFEKLSTMLSEKFKG